LPAAAIQRAALPRVLHLGAELGENDLVALRGIHALELGRPVLGARRRPPRRIVARRPGRAHVRGRAATASRTRRTTSSGGASCSTTSQTPQALSAGTSSSGITPPT